MTMCITPNNVVDAKRQRVAAPDGTEVEKPDEVRSEANPRVRMLYDNLRFILESRKVYLDRNINLTKLSQMEKPRDFDPFGQTGFAHLWLQYD